MANRIFLIAWIVAWIPFGLYCFFVPGSLQEAAGVAATNETGTTDLRAMYGGLQIAIGMLAVLALRDAARVRSTLLTLVVLVGGIGIARVLGAMLGGDTSPFTLGAAAFELAAAACAAWLLARSADGLALPAAG